MRIPYLSANTENLRAWQTRLGRKSRLRVGLAWSGSATHANDANRSIPLPMLAPLLSLPYEYHSLQKELRPQDAEFLRQNSIASHTEELHDFLDTASLVSEMDLTVTVDTSSVIRLSATRPQSARGSAISLVLSVACNWHVREVSRYFEGKWRDPADPTPSIRRR